MTDRGTRVRWTTAALVAPAAAALFTGTTVWASAHQPATASTTTTATPAQAQEKTVDPVVETLRTAIDSNSAQVLKLRATVAALQQQAAAIAKGANVPTAASGTSSTRRSSSSSSSSSRKTTTRSSSSTSSGSSRPTVSKPAPKPAPMPPVVASGGS